MKDSYKMQKDTRSTYDRIKWYRMGQKEKDTIIAKLKALLAKEKQVKIAWLFGSLTRRDSIRDIDLPYIQNQNLHSKSFLT
jgi:hypothetical protein